MIKSRFISVASGILLAITLVLACTTTSYAQDDTFICNGDLIITLSGSGVGGGTNAHNIVLNGAFAQFADLSSYTIPINSSGFNSQDGYIYGITSGNDIIRLKSNGDFDNLGDPGFLPFGLSAAGDFDADGTYWIHHRGDGTFYGIDVNNNLALVDQLELQWHPSTGNTGQFTEDIDDIAFDPLDKTAMYTYQRNGSGPFGTRGHLLRANVDPTSPEYGFIYSAGALSPSEIVHMGAMFFDSQGGLFGYGAGPGPFVQDRLIKIDRDPARANLVATGPGASANDGCSCPFSMFVTKRTPDSYNVCLGEPIVVTYEIGNTSNTESGAVTFQDTFPTGFVIEDIIFDEVFGIVRPGTGIGTNKITIDGINIKNKVVTFQALVRPSLVSGTYNIYAELNNLPPRFGDIIYSDDPETFASNDPTIFIVDYEEFKEAFEIGDDIVMCEGEIANFTANIPLAGTQITWNTGEQGPFASTADAGMVIATAELGICYDADTALVELVPYPVIDLDPFLTLCANESPVLQVPFDPQYTYLWSTGENNNAIAPTSSGEYTVIVDNRGCSTTASTEVELVFAGYDLTLSNIKACDGDSLSIDVTNPWPVDYEWTLPDGTTTADPSILNEAITIGQSGNYTVSMQYMGCDYTEDFDLQVNEYPEADLLPVERPCLSDDVFLSVPDEPSYSYNWNTGATTPDILVTESGDYVVTIENDGCFTVDSTEVAYVFEEFADGFPNIIVCEQDPIIFSAVNEDIEVTYLWTLPDGSVVTNPEIVIPQASEADAGTFSIEMEYGLCDFADIFTLDVNPEPSLSLDTEIGFDVCDSLTIKIEDVQPGSTVEWTPQELVNCQNCDVTTVMTTTSQYITVNVVDEIGCTNRDSVYLNIEDTGLGDQFNIPNIFSPNGDNNNDFFILEPLCYTINEFEIYDRWGNNVYSLEQEPTVNMVEWDGRNHVGDCAIGVYTWVGNFTFINSGVTKTWTGDVTIVR